MPVERENIEQLLSASRTVLLRRWLDAEMEAAVGEPSSDLVGVFDDVAARFEEWAETVAQHLCESWDYCAKKKQYSREVDLVTAVAAYLAAEAKSHAPVAAAVLMVRYGFDSMCRCK